MGSNTSKINETAAQTQKNESDVGDNPDPRSPTPEISRTPLQGKAGAKHNITKNVDLTKTFESGENMEKLIHNNPILSAVIKNHLQSYDPRSPTQDFDRTPVILGTTVEIDKNILRLQSENSCASPSLQDDSIANCETAIDANNLCQDIVVPKNLCQGFYDLTLDDTIQDTEEPLGSSTASNDAIENNISNGNVNPTVLLETNFDYVETDPENDDNQPNVVQSTNEKKPPIDIKSVPLFKILANDPRSPSVGIERTPIIIAKDTNENNVEEMSDDTLIKVLQNANIELRQTGNALDNNPDGLLIYEDETNSLNETPKKSKPNTNSGSRTPLSCMKNKEAKQNISKSANTVYKPNNQKMVPLKAKRTSHIPRSTSLLKLSKQKPTESSISLKNISKTSVGGDCENTPPHSHRDRWDKDSSIVL